MPLTAAEIYLTKRGKICIPIGNGGAENVALVATFNRNLNSIGFTMTGELISAMARLSRDQIIGLCEQIEPVAKRLVGAHRTHKPMYPNFPRQVMEASDLELYLNAMAHYWGSFLHDVTGVPARFLPEYEKENREALPDAEIHLRVIRLGDQADFGSVFTALVGSNGSLSESDKAVVTWFVENRRDVIPNILPAAIPQKENLTHLVGELLKSGVPAYLVPHLKTPTDVLRVAAVMSGGDVSLAKPTKFRRMKRAERRFLLSAMENSPALTEDMLRRPEEFKRLGRELRPGDYAKQFPKCVRAFGVVRNDEPFETFNGLVEHGLKTGMIESVASLLTSRPGEFARRLDHLLRKSDYPEAIVNLFAGVADKVSTPVLLQAYAHFKNREATKSRAFFPKGSVAKVQSSETPLPSLPPGISDRAAKAVRSVLVRRFAKLPPLGNVYLDPALRQQMVPFAQRSASKSLRTITRGSRLPLPDCTTLRFFVWWKDGESRTDIDLSACFLGDKFEYRGVVSYYNLRDLGCAHSGDVTSAPKGAAEFIDVDLKKVRAAGHHYMVMVLNSFTSQPFKDLPECFAGWMARSKVQSGEVFDARTVRDRIDVTADTKMCVPLLIDLQERQVIWTDIALKSNGCFANNVDSNKTSLGRMAKALATLPKPTLYDLFSMHAEARGRTAERGEAETVFGLYEGITPFDTDRIMSEFMA